jgi:Fur family ferric uptake transcriptional regulator
MSERRAISDFLALKGLRRTKIRKAVLAVLAEQARPLSHAEVRRSVWKLADRVTLYRTLEALRGAGLVHEVLGEDGIRRYCRNDPVAPGCPGNHPHFLCLQCGKMICLSGQSLPRVSVPEEFAVKGKQLVVFGLCELCSKRSAQRKR